VNNQHISSTHRQQDCNKNGITKWIIHGKYSYENLSGYACLTTCSYVSIAPVRRNHITYSIKFQNMHVDKPIYRLPSEGHFVLCVCSLVNLCKNVDCSNEEKIFTYSINCLNMYVDKPFTDFLLRDILSWLRVCILYASNIHNSSFSQQLLSPSFSQGTLFPMNLAMVVIAIEMSIVLPADCFDSW